VKLMISVAYRCASLRNRPWPAASSTTNLASGMSCGKTWQDLKNEQARDGET
jgi:hypothetical protein